MADEPWLWRQANRLASILQIASFPDWKFYVSVAFSAVTTAASWLWGNLSWPHLVIFALVSCGSVLLVLNQLQLRSSFGKNIPDPRVADRGLPSAPPAELTAKYIRGKRISIVDLTTPQDFMVRDKIFEACDFYGPAVIGMLGGGETTGCIFSSPTGLIDDMLLEIQPGRRDVSGAVGFYNCRLIDCRFFGVGVVGTRPVLDVFKASMGPPRPSSERT